MTFLGFLVLFDPLQPGIVAALQSLRDLGVSLKLITGDNALVAATVSKQAGLTNPKILTGADLRQMSQEALTTARALAWMCSRKWSRTRRRASSWR